MHPAFTTSSFLNALFRGFLLAGVVLGILWILKLPLDPKFCLIIFVVLGFSSAISFYDSSGKKVQTNSPEIMMKSVFWSFSQSSSSSPEAFTRAVTEYQFENSRWSPDEPLPMKGTVTVHLTLFHEEPETERSYTFDNDDSQWTQATLLYELHKELAGKSFLGDKVFFEGLVKVGDGHYHLLLGS